MEGSALTVKIPAVMVNWGHESVELHCGASGGGCRCCGKGKGVGAAVLPF